MATPLWALHVLTEELPGVEAERLRLAAQAASMPHLKDHDRRAMVRRLGRLTEPRGRRPRPAAPADPIAHDPIAAAAYFAAMGVRVRTTTTTEEP